MILRRMHAEARATDAEAVTKVMVAARRATLPGLAEPRTELEVEAWMRDVVLPSHSVLIAEMAGEIVGFAVRHDAWLDALYVKPGWTGKGIGQRLLDAMLAEAGASTSVMRLYTFQRNAGARRFYERNRFVAVAVGDGAGNEEREPDVLYERDLRRQERAP
jgi:GNAT superfamily N-acetyltransferase